MHHTITSQIENYKNLRTFLRTISPIEYFSSFHITSQIEWTPHERMRWQVSYFLLLPPNVLASICQAFLR